MDGSILITEWPDRRRGLRGGVIEGPPPYVDAVRRVVDERALAVATEELDIVYSELGGRAGVVGAATMARRRTGAPTPLTEQD